MQLGKSSEYGSSGIDVVLGGPSGLMPAQNYEESRRPSEYPNLLPVEQELSEPEGRPTRVDWRERRRYYFTMTPARAVITAAVRGVFDLISIRSVEGVENLPPSGPVVVIGNHLNNFDVFPMQFALPRPIFFMGKEELFRNPALDWVLRQLGGFPVRRGAGDAWALAHAAEVLQRGQVLGIFPEGKRSHGQGLAKAKSGAARLALTAGCPIVPAALHGVQYMFRHLPRRRTPVLVRIGPAVWPQMGESPAELTERMMCALAALLPPESRGVYR